MAISVLIDTPNRSHFIATEHASGGALSKEELYPVLLCENVPRLGTVAVKLSADRYTSSQGTWGDWRILVREVEPDKGIGDATRKLLREACEPVVREWLASPAYAEARRKAIAETCVRLVRESYGRYGIDLMRREVIRHFDELSASQADALTSAMNALSEAQRLLADAPNA